MGQPPARTGNGHADTLHDTMLPWMKAFCLWLLAPHPGGRKPRTQEQTRKASELAGYPITRKSLYQMRKRPDVQLFLQTLRASVTESAKEALALQHRRYVEAHLEGLERALEAGDYRAVPAYTVPILDRIVPKKQDPGAGNKTIVVHVNEATARTLMSGTAPDAGEIIVEPVVEEREES